MTSEPMTPCPPDSDLMKAFKAYQESEDGKNSKHWAMVLTPMWQAGTPGERTRHYEILSAEQRERHVNGSLWAAFMAGFAAAGGKVRF